MNEIISKVDSQTKKIENLKKKNKKLEETIGKKDHLTHIRRIIHAIRNPDPKYRKIPAKKAWTISLSNTKEHKKRQGKPPQETP